MKLAVVYPLRPRWPKMGWVADALENIGHDVTRVHRLDDLVAADRTCELLIFEHKDAGIGLANLRELAKKKHAPWVQWWFDLVALQPGPLASQSIFKTCGGVLRVMDRVFVKERGLLAEYASLGVKASWLDQACPSFLRACRHSNRPDWDVLILGQFQSGYVDRRRDAQTLVNAGFRVAWAGHNGSCPPPAGVEAIDFCPVEKLPELVSRAAVVLDVGWRSDLDGYWSDRLYIACGMGACVVRRSTPGEPDLSLGSYSTPAELVEGVARLVLFPDLRRSLGEQARREVMAAHTYEHRVQGLLNQCALQSLRAELAPNAVVAEVKA